MINKLDPRARLGVDIGGTFTDTVACAPDGILRIGKTLTTPRREGDGLLASVANSRADLSETALLVHGTTMVINALLERRGVRTAIVVTQGFRDMLALGRGSRPEIYNPFYKRDAPLVPDELRFELPERMAADGTARVVPTQADVDAVIERLRAAEVEAVAVAFLHSYRNSAHELLVARRISEALPDLFVTASSELSSLLREYERFSTAAANAYVGPLVGNYTSRLTDRLTDAGFRGDFLFLDATGGAIGRGTAERFPIRLVESGPVGGVIAATRISRSLDLAYVVTLDIGGTTAKSSLIEHGSYETLQLYWVNGYARGMPLQVPVVDIEEVGAGGGSIAWLDSGRLRVGPRSAGAEPGPACYGKGGTQPTVTDALVHCGHFHPSLFLAEIQLDSSAATGAIANLATRCGLTTNRLALGMLQLSTEATAAVVRRQTLERGLDPAGFTMIVSGGAGPGQACAVAAAVGIRTVLVPPHPGHFSALGMLQADLRFTRQAIIESMLPDLTLASVRQRISGLTQELDEMIARDSRFAGASHSEASLALRYAGQEHSLRLPLTPGHLTDDAAFQAGVRANFDALYRRRFGYVDDLSAIEVMDIEVVVQRDLPSTDLNDDPTDERPEPQIVRCLFDETQGFVDTFAYLRGALSAGKRYSGPLLVYEIGSITVVPPGWSLERSADTHLLISREDEA